MTEFERCTSTITLFIIYTVMLNDYSVVLSKRKLESFVCLNIFPFLQYLATSGLELLLLQLSKILIIDSCIHKIVDHSV
jgi:hypothetical protein